VALLAVYFLLLRSARSNANSADSAASKDASVSRSWKAHEMAEFIRQAEALGDVAFSKELRAKRSITYNLKLVLGFMQASEKTYFVHELMPLTMNMFFLVQILTAVTYTAQTSFPVMFSEVINYLNVVSLFRSMDSQFRSLKHVSL
jgi:hypothetical protein